MASESSLGIVAELEAASRLRTSQFIISQRPWLDLYGVRVSPKAAFGSVSNKPPYDSALLHRVLPDELLHEIFVRMPPYYLGRASCVCRKWRYAIRNPIFWRNACLKAWQLFGAVDNYKLLHSRYESSWRKMWLLRPRVRTDGLYVSRNTYIHTGVAEWRVRNPVHLVCYYRYTRFFSSGKFLYKNSSEKVKDVAKVMNLRASIKSDCVHRGQYSLTGDEVNAALMYPGMRPTVWRIRLRLRGTSPGANNRMDFVSLVTTGLNSMEANDEEDMLGIVEGWEDDESHSDVPATSHKRGLSTFVFVPFEEVATSVLNLPVEKMDYYVPD